LRDNFDGLRVGIRTGVRRLRVSGTRRSTARGPRLRAGINIPEFGGAVPADRQEPLAIGPEKSVTELDSMPANRVDRWTGARVPQLQGAVLAALTCCRVAREHHGAAGSEADAVDGGTALDNQSGRARGHIPEANGRVPAAGGDGLAVRSKGHGLDHVAVAT